MARNLLVKQADVARAVKGAIQGGIKVGRVEIEPQCGKIVIFTGEPDSNDPVDPSDPHKLNAWIKENAC